METTFIGNKEIEIYRAIAIPTGYGHKKITVELYYNSEYKKFSGTTNNMRAYDAAIDLEGGERYFALYELIEDEILDEVSEWLENL